MKPRVLYLVSDKDGIAASTMLTTILPRIADSCTFSIIQLKTRSSTHDMLDVAHADIPVWQVRCRSTLDLAAWKLIREQVNSFKPDVIHLLGVHAADVMSLMTMPFLKLLPPVRWFVSGLSDQSQRSSWPLRQLCRRATALASTVSEFEMYQQQHFNFQRVERLQPSITEQVPVRMDGHAFRQKINVPSSARLILVSSTEDSTNSFKAAIWAFDVLKYSCTDLHLLLHGPPDAEAEAEKFAKSLAFDDLRVRFIYREHDFASLLELTELVWITQSAGGIETALHGMAMGKAVVGFCTPDMAEIVVDQVTGILVRTDDKVRLAAATLELLEDAPRRQSMGVAGRERFISEFLSETPAQRLIMLYHEPS